MAWSRSYHTLVVGLLWVASVTPRVYAQSDLPLFSPSTGGKSINYEALQPGDIILSTTEEWESEVIRKLTG